MLREFKNTDSDKKMEDMVKGIERVSSTAKMQHRFSVFLSLN